MPEYQIKKDKRIFEAGSTLSTLAYIEEGKVRMDLPGCSIELSEGDVIGIIDVTHQTHSCSYYTLEDTVVETFTCRNTAEFGKLFAAKDVAAIMLIGFSKQLPALINSYMLGLYNAQTAHSSITQLYQSYVQLCKDNATSPKELAGFASLEKLSLDTMIPSWKNQYYKDLESIYERPSLQDLNTYASFYQGLIFNGCDDFATMLDDFTQIDEYIKETTNLMLNESGNDLFSLYSTLLPIVTKNNNDKTPVMNALESIKKQSEAAENVPKEVLNERLRDLREIVAHAKSLASKIEETSQLAEANVDIKDSLIKLLQYAEADEETTYDVRRMIAEYTSLPDRASSDDVPMKLRKSLTDAFYKLYSTVFFKAVEDTDVPTIVKMFLNFGYMDERLAGADNALYLYSLAENFGGNHKNKVYTAADWLTLVYQGKKEPRRNEFDLDYPAFIADQAKSGEIHRDDVEDLLKDTREKVLFEIKNLFRLGNRVTFGRVSTFCPVFSDHNISRKLPDCLCTPHRISEELGKITASDFGAFYRPVIYSNTEIGVNREYIQIEVKPDFILMPNVGIRGSMWQEIEGRDKLTPSTFLLPVFLQENFEPVLTRMVGEFRWEMCKRIQGSTWNDVTDHSLTSDYFDYCQFFKKNNELTPEAKEKLSAQIRKFKSNYKECFLYDYALWILFEAKGAPRLNKFARTILFTYCTFSKTVREKLGQNPMYEPIITKHLLRQNKETHRLDMLIYKLDKFDGGCPEELTNLRAFYEL